MGFVIAASVLSAGLLFMSPQPGPPAEPIKPQVPEGHKSLMRREASLPKAPAPVYPEHWGSMMRREAPLVPAAAGTASPASAMRVVLMVLFGVAAISGFAMQAKSSIAQLMNLPDIQKKLGLKENK